LGLALCCYEAEESFKTILACDSEEEHPLLAEIVEERS
jgi:hypothetical protein